MPNKGYFVIADITGYTAFLTGSELEHAQDILKTLFNTLLDNIKPPLIISNFQGDAILTYAPDGAFMQGQILLEAVENLYCAFAATLERMHRNTTCTCRACSNIPKLDLKMFIHHGEYIMQDMRGKEELSGPDVIIAHRMMKNEVKEKTGLKAYALFSEAAINALGLQAFTCEMRDHQETYEHIGDVKMFAYCLKTMWEREREKRRIMVDKAQAWMLVEGDVSVPPAVVWDYLTEPNHKREIFAVQGMSLSNVKNGRVGVGSVQHCAHGTDTTTDFVIMDWRPFEYISEAIIGLPMGMTGFVTTYLTPTETGTHITWAFEPINGKNTLSKLMARAMGRILKKELGKDYAKINQRLGDMLAAEYKAPALNVN